MYVEGCRQSTHENILETFCATKMELLSKFERENYTEKKWLLPLQFQPFSFVI